MHTQFPDSVHLIGLNSSLIIGFDDETPRILYWGAKLSSSSDLQMLSALRTRQEVPASPAKEVKRGLSPTSGQGFSGTPGISLRGATDQWAFAPTISSVSQPEKGSVIIVSEDKQRQVQLTHQVVMDEDTDVVSFTTEITNNADLPITIDWCAAASIPMAGHINQILAFEGHWAGEFHEQHTQQFFGTYLRENRKGRTSHDNFPGLIMHSTSCDQLQGQAYGFHLAWSGNNRVLSEKMSDGRAMVQMGELLLPNEVQLDKHQSYQSPKMYASFSAAGFNGLSQQYHRFVRSHLIAPHVRQRPRPVHYNTWEGIYFDHDVYTLKSLADRAALIGVERFVLDDGWFIGRNDDTAGLGDWYIDEKIYPQGLAPLIEHVNQQGMEFGLWVEPEMVNPNSNLFRQHPDWVLSLPPNKDVGFRNQLVLDLTRPEVFDYLYERLDDLLTNNNIGYLKWDMNRDLNQPGNSQSQPAVHQQTLAVYALLEKIKAAHPSVEIESCASGGGRADYGILEHTDRIWTSDSNDAIERLRIQRGFSYFFPAELMGSHVGPRDCHITHRNIPMEMRASVALFGHFGMEMDLRELTDNEVIQLQAMTNLYKQHRNLIHSGDLYRLPLADYATGFGIVAEDKSEAIFSYSLIECHNAGLPDQYLFAGLKRANKYKLDIVWPVKSKDSWPASSIFGFETNLSAFDGQVFSGELLMQLGLQLPRLTPQSSLIFHLTEVP